jgi:predicted ATP-grasp superfamily ATP-dependent carboligase
MRIFEASQATHRSGVYYQEFVEGTALSGVFVATATKCRLLGITKQLLGREWDGPTDFAYVGSVGPLDVAEFGGSQWRRLGAALVEKCGLRGVFGVDAVLKDDKIWPIEVNPRFPASAEILERAENKLSVVGLHLDAFGGREFHHARPSANRSLPVHAKAIVWARDATNITESMIDDIMHRRSTMPDDVGPKYADVPRSGVIAKGHPILTVFTCGGSVKSVEQSLRQEIIESHEFLGDVS